ncbi:UvrD-helicase domain-containing protein [Catellatospora coxensis]
MTVALTAEQQEAVRQPADTRLLIIAAAGTGKTHTLVRRLEYLLEHDLTADEILVLSFSRAAVGELATRARASAGSSRFVVARTFDAWALDLLVHTRAAEDWHHRSFDERITAATDVIISGQADEYTARVRHVLLDEIQDLEGDRRELVKSLLTWLDCGFTIVGDPAQAIYGFQVRDASRPDDDGDMFTWARETYPDDLVELALTRDFRARTPRPDGILRCGRRCAQPVTPDPSWRSRSATSSRVPSVQDGLLTSSMALRTSMALRRFFVGPTGRLSTYRPHCTAPELTIGCSGAPTMRSTRVG